MLKEPHSKIESVYSHVDLLVLSNFNKNNVSKDYFQMTGTIFLKVKQVSKTSALDLLCKVLALFSQTAKLYIQFHFCLVMLCGTTLSVCVC